jgi:hypothetical protein
LAQRGSPWLPLNSSSTNHIGWGSQGLQALTMSRHPDPRSLSSSTFVVLGKVRGLARRCLSSLASQMTRGQWRQSERGTCSVLESSCSHTQDRAGVGTTQWSLTRWRFQGANKLSYCLVAPKSLAIASPCPLLLSIAGNVRGGTSARGLALVCLLKEESEQVERTQSGIEVQNGKTTKTPRFLLAETRQPWTHTPTCNLTIYTQLGSTQYRALLCAGTGVSARVAGPRNGVDCSVARETQASSWRRRVNTIRVA